MGFELAVANPLIPYQIYTDFLKMSERGLSVLHYFGITL
jgi:hypothetical protein